LARDEIFTIFAARNNPPYFIFILETVPKAPSPIYLICI